MGKKLGIPPVVTNDSHYTREKDATSHDTLLCIQTGKTLADADRFRLEGGGYYIKPAAQMYGLDTSDYWQEGCRNSQLLIADRVDTTACSTRQPDAPVPHPGGLRVRRRPLPRRGVEGHGRRYPDGYDEDHRRQAEYEIQMICQMGFPGISCGRGLHHAGKNNGVAVGPGRGSAAGSIVAYAMGITDLDPLTHGLSSSGSSSRARVHADIDIDFDDARAPTCQVRDPEVGLRPVAQIITYGTIKAKAAIKDSCRVLGFPYALGDRITKAFPPP